MLVSGKSLFEGFTIPVEEEGSGLVVELILSLHTGHTESLLSILFASGETDEELICGSVASFSLTCLDFFSKKLDWSFLFFTIHTS